jgi:hypothetical protein
MTFAEKPGGDDGSGADPWTLQLKAAVAATIAPFNKIDLLKRAAALQLLPENSHALARLEYLAAISIDAAAVPGGPVMSNKRLLQVLSDGPLDAIAQMEDPFENLFTERVEYDGREYVLPASRATALTYAFSHVVRALAAPTFDDGIALRTLADAVVRAAFTIGHQVAARAGLKAEVPPAGSGDLRVPFGPQLQVLKSAAAISVADLDAWDLSADAIERLATPAFTRDLDIKPAENPLYRRPLVSTDDGYVVAIPNALTDAALSAVLEAVAEAGRHTEYDEAFHRSVAVDAWAAAERMGFARYADAETIRDVQGIGTRVHFQVDLDKCVHLEVITQGLATFRGGTFDLNEGWSFDPTFVDHACPARRQLRLRIFQTLGAPAFFMFINEPEQLEFAMSAEELDIISWLELDDPLALWKFVEAHAHVRATTRVMCFDTLSEFGLYRSHRHSYYVSDDRLPDMLTITSDFGAAVRDEAARRSRSMLVPSIEAMSRPDDDAPILDSSILPLGVSAGLLPADFPPFRAVREADEERLADAIGAKLIAAQELKPGPVPVDRVSALLNAEVQTLYADLTAGVARYDKLQLLQALIGAHETTVREIFLQRATVPFRADLFDSADAFYGQVKQELALALRTSSAQRFLIELVAAAVALGDYTPTLAQLDELQAIALRIIDRAAMSDAVKYGLADIPLMVLASGRIGSHATAFGVAHERFLSAFTEAEIASRSRGADDPTARAIDYAPLLTQLDETMSAEIGVSLRELASIFGRLVHFGAGMPFTLQPEEQVLAELRRGGLVLPDDGLDRFCLDARADFLKPPSPYRPEDVYPWRVNRRLSYRWRPLVRLSINDQRFLLWGPRHLFAAWRYYLDQLLSAQFPARSKALVRVMSAVKNDITANFENHVAALFARDGELIVRRGVKKVKAGDVTLRPPGDIDVLVVRPRKKAITLVECKDLAARRDPHEQNCELIELLGPSDTPTILDRHAARIAWARDNVPAILEWLGLERSGGWRVRGVIVTDDDLVTRYTAESDLSIPLIALHDLQRDDFDETRVDER